MLPDSRIVAIVGRPNVGKSALFNRLAGRTIAIVHDQPGITRDRINAPCKLGEIPFEIIDTGGIGADVDTGFSAQVRIEAETAMDIAAVILLVVDGRQGLTPLDQELSTFLRRARKPVLLIVNKLDHDKHVNEDFDFARLGIAESFSISAAHGHGILPLVDRIQQLLPKSEEAGPPVEEGEEPVAAPEEIAPLKIAFVGRPNVGKSSLTNAILGDNRTIVSDVAGTTRDSVDIEHVHDGRPYIFIDTAGIRARRKHDTSVEVFSVMRSERSIRRADLCVLVLDAAAGVTAQDKKIAGIVQAENKPCLIVLNKWDLVRPPEAERKAFLKEIFDKIRSELFAAEYAPICVVSALENEAIERCFMEIEKIRRGSLKRTSTGKLNRIFQEAVEKAPPAIRGGKRFKVLYVTQVKPDRPTALPVPRFVLFVNDARLLDDSYARYLKARLREIEPYPGLPVILQLNDRERKGATA